MNTPHPEYDMKRRIYERPLYTARVNAQALPIQPVTQPTRPILNQEQIIRMLKEGQPIYRLPQPEAYPIEAAEVTGIQPTNPGIIERLNAYGEVGSRPWYPEPYIPYVGWPNRYLQSGIQV